MTDTTKQFDPIEHTLKRGAEYPYHGQEPKTWAEVAACAILYDLTDRRGIKHALREIDNDVRAEIVESLAKYIARAAAATPSPVPADTAELPPLPDSYSETRINGDVVVQYFTADQMRDYARAALASRPAPVAEQKPVAMVDAGDDGMFAEILPDVSVKVGQMLYAAPVAAVPEGMVPLRMEWEPGYSEDVAFGSQVQMDRLKKWLDKYFAMIAAPSQPDQSAQEPRLFSYDATNERKDVCIVWPDGEYTYYVREAAPSAAQAAGVDVRNALQRAFSLGETHWQQSDSEYRSQNKKADETYAKFQKLVEDTCAALVTTPSEGVAAPVEQVTSEPVAWKLTTIAPEGRKPLVFLIDNKDEATYAHSLWEGSVLTPLCPLSPAQPSAEQARDAALEEAATICDSADKSTHPADLADRIRAKRTTAGGEKGSDRG